jgi:pyruvate formate lyase activating enzyme
MSHPARFWTRVDAERIRCDLCPHGCVLREGETGLCHVRGVRDGALRALGYGAVSSAGLDPIEKKPLYHFHPGSVIFSVGGWGCNFACRFCQNWSISQDLGDTARRVAPERLAAQAGHDGSIGLAYTYNEPWTGYEFMADCARAARERGLVNVLVTNGFVRSEPAAELLPLVDALNIDIKSMEDVFYRDQCRGRLQPVLDSAVQARAAGCHIEITNLLIPGLNAREAQVTALAEWILANLGADTPLHLSAYTPRYRATEPPTEATALERGHAAARRVGLHYVYTGNLPCRTGRDSVCPSCGATLVARDCLRADPTGLNGPTCAACGAAVPFVV